MTLRQRVLALTIIAATGLGQQSIQVRAAVPFTPAGDGHDTIPAYVNGKGPFAFILDTGADGSALYQWFAEKERLKKGSVRDIDGQTGSVSSSTYSLKTLSVDGHASHHIIADGLPNRHDAGVEAGVAGNDLMDGTIALFDFPCRRVEIKPKPVDVHSMIPSESVMVQGGSVPEGTQLTLSVTIRGVEGTAYLDTGSRDTRISPSFAAAAHIDPSSPDFRDAEARVIDLPVFETFRSGGPPSMILGTDLMQGYRLVYDHEAKRFWFTPSSCTQPTRVSRNFERRLNSYMLGPLPT